MMFSDWPAAVTIFACLVAGPILMAVHFVRHLELLVDWWMSL